MRILKTLQPPSQMISSLLQSFIKHIGEGNLFQENDPLIIAVSGGADSVVLCELCHEAGFRFDIAHCNFQLRGAESERDEAFVRSLGKTYTARVRVKRFDTQAYAAQKKISIQVAARELRYHWFSEIVAAAAGEAPAGSTVPGRQAFVLTAHHANDNIETLLMNFFKGTGIKGLHGIRPKQGRIVRPLLFATKEALLAFARQKALLFVEDSSNISDKYTRNYFRNQVIPAIQNIFPGVEENLLHNIERFRETEQLYDQAIGFHKKKLLVFKKSEVFIPVLKLLKTTPVQTVLYEIIKDYGFSGHQINDVLHLLQGESGKFVSSGSHKIIRDRKWIIISPINTGEAATILIEPSDRTIIFEKGELTFKLMENPPSVVSKDPLKATLDAAGIIYPLLVRKWKQGDYFYPLGMQKKKKLSRFFIDQKLSLSDKEKMWVIESQRRILWIIGQRIDDRFKIRPNTKTVLQLDFSER